ncbi:hypothetical protein [Oceanobacillus sojae]
MPVHEIRLYIPGHYRYLEMASGDFSSLLLKGIAAVTKVKAISGKTHI